MLGGVEPRREAILDELLVRAAATLEWPAASPSQPPLPGLEEAAPLEGRAQT